MGEERGGGGGSETSDLGAKTRKKRKIKRENESHFWSRSPSPFLSNLLKKKTQPTRKNPSDLVPAPIRAAPP
jgi:hypothetical protein